MKMTKSVTVGIPFVLCAIFLGKVLGHGLVIDPPNRSSMWRFFADLPPNYNDNQNFCGGYSAQWKQNGGNCGPCGDNYADSQPRENENTGTYGNGVVSGQYIAGSVMNVSVTLTGNHMGYFNYSICALEDTSSPETEDCFVGVPLIDGTYNYSIDVNINKYVNQLQLPADLICDRCVLRWHYFAGNSWGVCDDGTTGVGCGPQETFRTCSDIAIAKSEEDYDSKVAENIKVISSKMKTIASALT